MTRRAPVRRRPPARHQRGAALLLTLLLMVVIMSGTLFAKVNSRLAERGEDPAQTGRALRQAKAALIAYGVTGEDRPGELPCPDLDNNGNLEVGVDLVGSSCVADNGSVYVGWLPYRQLDLDEPKDGSGHRLWYAVAKSHARVPGGSPPVLNSRTPAPLSSDGFGDGRCDPARGRRSMRTCSATNTSRTVTKAPVPLPSRREHPN
jgi:hypothetical protein